MENKYKDDNEIIKIREWKTPATDYPEKQTGSARINVVRSPP